MDKIDLNELLVELVKLPKESEWVEFKQNFHNEVEIGERISALSNGAALFNQQYGYLVFGVKDNLQTIEGTSFKPSTKKVKGQEGEGREKGKGRNSPDHHYSSLLICVSPYWIQVNK